MLFFFSTILKPKWFSTKKFHSRHTTQQLYIHVAHILHEYSHNLAFKYFAFCCFWASFSLSLFLCTNILLKRLCGTSLSVEKKPSKTSPHSVRKKIPSTLNTRFKWIMLTQHKLFRKRKKNASGDRTFL